MTRRLAWGGGAVLLLVLAALISMIRIVPAPTPAAAPVPTDEAPMGAARQAPSGPGETHPPLLVPVAGVPRATIVDTWGQSRAAGARAHEGTDIIAPGGTPVVAAAPGTVEKLFFSQGGGGITLYVRSPDRRWSYYYAHLRGYAPGMREGMAVGAGQLLGFVGDTGNSGAGNYHLHFGVARMTPGARWHEGVPVNAYPLLVDR